MKPLLAALLGLVSVETTALAESCVGPLGPTEIIKCALAQSPEVKKARLELRALGGRRTAAGAFLPANPVVSISVATRTASALEAAAGQTFLNWGATISQEVEIAGQRGLRVAAAEAESAAAEQVLATAEREVGAAALLAFYEVVAAREAVTLAAGIAKVADTLVAVAEARAEQALISPVDADLARAEALRVGLTRFESERRLALASTTLSILLQGDPAAPPNVVGELRLGALELETQATLSALTEIALRTRGEVSSASIEREVLARRIALLRRARIPNPTLSVFFQRDGLNEQVFGAGISVPMPLPSPIGRTNAGEIEEAIARLEQGESDIDRVRRRVRSEVAEAWATVQARGAAIQSFSPVFLAKAKSDLGVLGEGIGARQLSLRDALVTQRTFIELLQADLEARLAYARAVVELRRAAGLPLVPVSR